MSAQNDKQNEIRQSVEQAVAKALREQLPQLQSQIVQQVLDALPPQESEAPAAADSNALVEAVSSIHAGSTQKEILRALLDAGSGYCSRIALFVVKAGAASGWQSRGFGDDEAVKDFALDLAAGPVAHTYQNRIATPGNVTEMGAPFADHFGRPANEQVLVLPLALKEKVAALVYADGGDSNKLDQAAVAGDLNRRVAGSDFAAKAGASQRRWRYRESGSKRTPARADRLFIFRSLRRARAQAHPRHICARARARC